jgi:Cu/Ag efflux pump CusA
LREVEKMIVKVPEVQAYSRRTGTEMGFFITEPNSGDYLIQLKKKRKRTTEAVIADIRKQIDATQPALQIDFGQVIGDMLGDLMASVQPIEIKVFGNNNNKLHDLSEKIGDITGSVEGAADVFNGIIISGPSISILPNNAALAQFGLTPQSLQTQIQLALQGIGVGNILENEQFSNIRIVYPNNTNQSVEGIKQLRIFSPSGRLIPITTLATIRVNKGDAEIQRGKLTINGCHHWPPGKSRPGEYNERDSTEGGFTNRAPAGLPH